MTSNSLLKDLAKLFETNQRQLYVAALAITHDRGAAEDAVHDAMLAVSALQSTPRNLKAYLIRTIRNKALHSVKRAKRTNSAQEYDNQLGNGSQLNNFLEISSQSPEQLILAAQVVQQLDSLEQNHQQVIVMKLFGDLTFEEIATITETSPNTIASWYRRGLKKLQENIYDYQE